MKPDEIKRCLEVCINDDCDNCKHSFGNCVRNLMTNTLAYINELETEVEKFTTAYPKTFESIRKIYTTAKSEAIKEFAEKLKAEYDGFDERSEMIMYNNLLVAIDDVVKEMVGGNNATD